MNRFEARRFSDPVHGTIGLSDLEVRVVSTQAFQRLKNVKQLSLAYHVFPGADYSRFAHSVGVCHITGRILSALRGRYPEKVTEDDIQLYRLAALLHDVGHYPFSHTVEHVIEDFYSKSLFAETTTSTKAVNFFNHERVSKEVVLRDEEIRTALQDHDAKRITAVFMREEPPPFSNLVSSDLDADRIDYLLRTAHHTGLPYGSVDLNYIISQMRVDKTARVCLTGKAVRAADHFLLSRVFDYQQVSFHKTVSGLEWVLGDVLAALLKVGVLDGSASGITEAISSGAWRTFDDAHVVGLIRKHQDALGWTVKPKVDALLLRHPPKLLVEREYIAPRGKEEQDKFRVLKKMVRSQIQAWADRSGIPADSWHLWTKNVVLTKVGSSVPLSSAIEHETEDEEAYEQAIRILDGDGSASRPIVELPHSLMAPLSEQAIYVLRVYVLQPANAKDPAAQVDALRAMIREDTSEVPWK